MKESIVLEINSDSDWDGNSATDLNRDNATVTQQRYYKFQVAGPHGVIAADMGGLFAPMSAKLVGVSSASWNPESKARVIGPAPLNNFRQEITLSPEVQHVVLYPGDRLSLLTKDGRPQIYLTINEMSESDSVEWAVRHEGAPRPTRFRIIRQTGVAFAPNLGNLWQPVFTYDATSGLLVTTDDHTGRIPTSALCLYPRFQGCYVTIRYAGHNNNGKLHMVDAVTHKSWVAESGMTDVKWSKVQFISHDDGIALEASPAMVGQVMTCDIEVALVHPGNRLAGRFAGGN